MDHSTKIIQFLDNNFNEKKCNDLCRQYKFIKRSTSKIKGHEFIKTMIMPSEGLSMDSLKGLCKRMVKFNPKADLSAQALCERINSPSSSELMKGLFGEMLDKIHQIITKSCPELAEVLKGIKRVLVQDSTVATLNKKLEGTYTGTSRGNNCVKSQVKIDAIHDLCKGLLVDAELFRGNEPDQGLSGRIMKFIQKGDLVIRDLGYFTIQTFQSISQKGAYYLSRLMSRVNFFLSKEDEKPLDLGEHLAQKQFSRYNIINLEGYLGKEKIPVRLVIYRQTQEVTSQRLRMHNKHARKKGVTMSKSKRLLLTFAIFVTNTSEKMISAEMIGTVYRLRWEIELVFKRWKSQLEIDHLKGIHKERIDCLIWARLCTVMVTEMIIGCFKKMVHFFSVELSEVKVIQYLMRANGFCLALEKGTLESFFKEMQSDIPRMLLKDKRERKTMRERVSIKESYYEIQTTVN